MLSKRDIKGVLFVILLILFSFQAFATNYRYSENNGTLQINADDYYCSNYYCDIYNFSVENTGDNDFDWFVPIYSALLSAKETYYWETYVYNTIDEPIWNYSQALNESGRINTSKIIGYSSTPIYSGRWTKLSSPNTVDDKRYGRRTFISNAYSLTKNKVNYFWVRLMNTFSNIPIKFDIDFLDPFINSSNYHAGNSTDSFIDDINTSETTALIRSNYINTSQPVVPSEQASYPVNQQGARRYFAANETTGTPIYDYILDTNERSFISNGDNGDWIPGKNSSWGNSIRLDGINEAILTGYGGGNGNDVNDTYSNCDAFSISMFVQTTDTGGNPSLFGSNGASRDAVVNVQAINLASEWGDANVDANNMAITWIGAGANLTDGFWHHFLFSKAQGCGGTAGDNVMFQMYIDGVNVSTRTINLEATSSMPDNAWVYNFSVASRAVTDSNYLNSTIDELIIFNRAVHLNSEGTTSWGTILTLNSTNYTLPSGGSGGGFFKSNQFAASTLIRNFSYQTGFNTTQFDLNFTCNYYDGTWTDNVTKDTIVNCPVPGYGFAYQGFVSDNNALDELNITLQLNHLPNVSLESPPNSTPNASDIIIFKFTGYDSDNDVLNYTLFSADNDTNPVNFLPVFSQNNTEQGVQVSYTRDKVVNGTTISWLVQVQDAFGGIFNSSIFNVTANYSFIPPNVTNTTPRLNSIFNISSDIEIGVNVSDDGFVSKVFVNLTYPNGSFQWLELFNSTDEPSLFNISYHIETAIGLYNLTFFANDSLTTFNYTEMTNFTIKDVFAPNVTHLRPLNQTSRPAAFNISESIEIGVNVSDQVFISKVFANMSYPNGSIILLELLNSTDDPSYFNLSYTFDNVIGNYNITFVANDSSNNYNRSVSTNFTLADVIAPNVTHEKPLNQTSRPSAFNISEEIEIRVNVTDQEFISKVYANISYPNGSFILFELFNSAQDLSIFNISYTIAPNIGNYNITFIANDTSNNYNRTISTNFSVQDVVPPNITNLTPSKSLSVTVNNSIEIGINLSDQTIISIAFANLTYPNGSYQYLALSNSSGNPGRFNISFVPKGLGLYNISFFANDSSNNINSTEMTNFTSVAAGAGGEAGAGGGGGARPAEEEEEEVVTEVIKPVVEEKGKLIKIYDFILGLLFSRVFLIAFFIILILIILVILKKIPLWFLIISGIILILIPFVLRLTNII